MKKLTAIIVAVLVMVVAVVSALQIFATDDSSYVLSDDHFVPFELEVWGDKDEPVTQVYYYSGLEDGTVTDTSRSLYGQFDVNFCLKAKDGVKVKLMRYYDYASLV